MIDFILEQLTVTKVLLALLIILISYYIWPVIFDDKLSHVSGPSPKILFGTLQEYMSKGHAVADMHFIKQYGNVFRMHEGRLPALVIADPKILKHILVKDFSNFINHRELPMRGILKHSVFDARGESWRRNRRLLTPTLTSGKLKAMTPMIEHCAETLSVQFGLKSDSNQEMETKEYASLYALDVIAKTGFGLDYDMYKDTQNVFARHARMIMDIDLKSPVMFLMFFFPFLTPVLDKLGFLWISRKGLNFFSELMDKLIKERQALAEKPVDILQMIIDAHTLALDEEAKIDLKEQGPITEAKSIKGFTELEMVAHSLTFFIAGYDTMATTLSFLLYELSQNPGIQEQVYDEITSVIGTKKADHDNMNKLVFLDQCIQETLRKYPPLSRSDRESVDDTTIEGIKIPRRTLIVIPIYAIHHDPTTWPDPDKFDPERFTPEEKTNRDPFTYLPFGLGPRQCIGIRLAMLEIKMAAVQILQQFKLHPSKKPMELKHFIFISAKEGAWVIPKRR